MRRTELSGSNAYRRMACLGSRAMERDLIGWDPDDTAEGAEIHDLLADPSLPRDHLSENSAQCLRRCEQEAEKAIAYCVSQAGSVVYDDRELEIGFAQGSGRPLMLNHIDRRVRGEAWSLVIDYKTGRIPVDLVEDNWQVAAYLVAEAAAIAASPWRYFGQIIQPRVSRESPIVEYSTEHLEAAKARLIDMDTASLRDGAPRVPGAHCSHCLGYRLGVCPDVRTLALALPTRIHPPHTPEEFWALIDPKDRTRLLISTKHAADMAKILRDAARNLMAKDPDFIPGFGLGKAGEARSIEDPQKIAQRLLAIGATEEQIRRLFSISVTDVEVLVAQLLDIKGKSLDATVDGILKGVVDTYARKQRIVKVPAKKRAVDDKKQAQVASGS